MAYQTKEDLVRVAFEVPFTSKGGNSQTETIFVIDYSGSMAGSPWKQVLEAVKYIQSTSTGKLPTFILYDHSAAVVTAEKILKSRAEGGTSFHAALTVLWDHISKNTPADCTVSVVFMTDGQCPVNTFQPTGEKIRGAIANGRRRVAMHTIGFGSGHDQKTLAFVRSLGNKEGTYRYTTGNQLEGSFAEMFDFLDLVETVAVTVGGQTFENVDAQKADNTLQVDWIFKKPSTAVIPEGQQPMTAQVRIGGKGVTAKSVAVTLAWTEPDSLFELKSVETLVIEDVAGLKQAQAVLSKMDPTKVPRLVRDQAFQMRMAVQQQLDKYAALFAEAARGTISKENMVGQLQSMRYDHRFAKARRARAMNMRTTSNAANFATIQTTLDELKRSMTEADKEAFKTMDTTCVLTGDTISEMMEQSSSDIMMFGLRVQRPEYVVDAPSMVRVEDVLSGTYTSDAVTQSIKFALAQTDPTQVHGGFSHTTHGSVGYFIGPDGKPMNACLPLYINEAHFKRVKHQLPPLLGFFFTLDPMGFKPDQYLALFTIYGQMLAMRTSGALCSQWADNVVQSMANLCHAIKPKVLKYLAKGSYANGKLTKDPYDAFIESSAGRTKEVMQSLYTVIGWAMASPAQGEALAAHIKAVGSRQEFVVPLVEELWCRQLANHYKTTDHVAMAVVEQLMYGPAQPAPGKDGEVADAAGTELLGHNDAKKEKQYEMWAKYKLGLTSRKATEEIERKCKGGPEPEAAESAAKYEERPLRMYGGSPQHDVFLDSVAEAELAKVAEGTKDICLLLGEPQFGGQLRWLMLVQAMLHLRGTSTGPYPNTLCVLQDPAAPMLEMHQQFERYRKESFDAMQRKNQDYAVAQRMAQTSNLWAFVGRLLKSAPTRGGLVFDSLTHILADGKVQGRQIPHLKEKIAAVLTGRLAPDGGDTRDVLAGGQSWPLCPVDLVRRFKTVLGDDDFTAIELSMVGKWGWVYRESDIPNRHGHCNSHPNPKLAMDFKGFQL